MNVTKDDIYLDNYCKKCGGQIVIIPAHGMFLQHEDSELEADHEISEVIYIDEIV